MKPYIICHMIASIDGRIDCDMTEQIEDGNGYYEALNKLQCPSMLMGRVTMQMHYALEEPFTPADTTAIGGEKWHVARQTDAYCIAIDTHGHLQWGENEYDGQALLVVTDENCPQSYHNYLTEKGISWIATGHEGINLHRAMEILGEIFGIHRLAITGGGNINGAFLAAGLLDEISFMVAPGIDGRKGMTAVFDGIDNPQHKPTRLNLISVEQMGHTIWMRYTPA